MYGIGDRVVYGAFGVMEIIDVTEQTLGDVTKKYYVLKEYSSHSTSLTYVPLDNELLVEQMKPLLTRDEIVEVVRSSRVAPPIPWMDDNRARSEFYKKILGMSDRLQLLLLIDAVNKTGIRRESEGKKNFIADENAMSRAKKLICTEFALVLGIPETDVPDFIESVK